MSRPFALVTGGTSGIGKGIAQALADNYDLALVYSQNQERAEACLHELQQMFPKTKISLFQKTLTDYNSAQELHAAVKQEFSQGAAVLVNAAGRLRDGLFIGSSFQDHQDHLQEHTLIPMALCHLFAKDMYNSRFGRIINLSSISAHYSKRGQANYAAAKAAIEGFTRTFALEVAHRGITVNAIAPGLIETPMTEDFVKSLEQTGVNLKKRIPVGRLGTIAEVGALARFICSEHAAYITGTVITIDGGRSLGDPNS